MIEIDEDENAHHSDAAVMLVQIVQRHYSAHGLHRTSRQGSSTGRKCDLAIHNIIYIKRLKQAQERSFYHVQSY